jgi:NAD(P)H-flavin reductase
VFVPAQIHELRAETPEHVHFELAAPPEFLSAYTIPGQYVQIQIQTEGLKPAFFAMASGPARERFEFLVKRGSPIGAAIASRKSGETLHLTAPAGKGYPLAQGTGRDVFLVGSGTGISPLRSLMHTLLSRRAEFGRIVFLYGARKTSHVPYSAEAEQWKAAGVQTACIISQPDAGTWNGPTGHVQKLIADSRPNATSAVFVCGQKPMVEGVKAAFAELGVGAERIFQNF